MIKKERIKMIYIAAAVILLITAAGCGQNAKIPAGEDDMAAISVSLENNLETVSGAELMCSAADENEASKIARDYGITLNEFRFGVATFHTDEDPREVIKRGKRQGLKELSLNTVTRLDDPVR